MPFQWRKTFVAHEGNKKHILKFIESTINLNLMNFLDLLIAIPLGFLIFKGYKKGLIYELASLAGIVIGSLLAVRLANWFSALIGLDGENALLIAFFIIFIAVIILSLFVAKLVERFVKLMHVGIVNNLAGALFGLLKGACIVGVLLYYVAVIDLNEKVLTRDAKDTSILYSPVERTGRKLAGKMDYYVSLRKQQHEQQENANR